MKLVNAENSSVNAIDDGNADFQYSNKRMKKSERNTTFDLRTFGTQLAIAIL